jgi:8-oxo-dGTP pyrophosphatase MutT (NUDIX family)
MLLPLLDRLNPFTIEETAALAQLRQFLQMSDNPYDRSNLIAHVVADAWIVNPARTHVLMVEHKLNKCWMAPGGHCDGDPDVMAGALREAQEEAGLTDLKPLLNGNIFTLNSGHVPLRTRNGVVEPDHIHFDVCFAFEAQDNAALAISDESTGLQWIALSEIENYNTFPSHRHRITKTRAGLLG